MIIRFLRGSIRASSDHQVSRFNSVIRIEGCLRTRPPRFPRIHPHAFSPLFPLKRAAPFKCFSLNVLAPERTDVAKNRSLCEVTAHNGRTFKFE